MGELVPGGWEYRETDEERWLRELLAWIEGVRASRVGTGRTITLHIDVIARPEDVVGRTAGGYVNTGGG